MLEKRLVAMGRLELPTSAL